MAGRRFSDRNDDGLEESRAKRKAGSALRAPNQAKRGVFRFLPWRLVFFSQHRRNQRLENPTEPNQKNPGLVFCSPEGDYYKPDQISSAVAEIMAKAGLRGVSLHSLRHTHASQLLSQGVPIPTVSKRLGQANPTITLKLYSHALESDELAAAQRWNDAFADVIEVHANTTTAKGG